MFSSDNIADLVMSFVCLLFSLSVHEASHAAMSNYRGDSSARLLGRLTLNPLAHIDPMGTLILPLLLMMMGAPVFGWAKPVPFNPKNLKNMRLDPVFIALAGPGSNFVLFLMSAVVMKIIVVFGGVDTFSEALQMPAFRILFLLMRINLILMLFNLLPVPPLDGHHVLYYFLPPSGQRALQRVGPFGLIFVLLFAGRFIGKPLFFLLDLALRWIGL